MLRLVSGFGKSLLVILVIAAVMALFQNNGSNKHRHILPNGEVVEHSHPFRKSNTDGVPASHGHDALEFIFFGQVSDTITEVAATCLSFDVLVQHAEPKVLYDSACYKELLIKSNTSRGPPVFFAA